MYSVESGSSSSVGILGPLRIPLRQTIRTRQLARRLELAQKDADVRPHRAEGAEAADRAEVM